MKVLDVASLREGIHATLQEIEKVQSQLSRVQRSIRDIIALNQFLKGKTGEAIRSFYKQIHSPFLIFIHESLTDYAVKLKNIEQAIQSYEPDDNGLIRREFLEYHVMRGLERTEDIASELVAQTNREIASIADLVSLTRLNMSELSFVVHKGRQQTRQIVHQLHELDHTQTKNLAEVKEKLDVMKQYTSEMRRTFNQSSQSVNSFGLPSMFILPTLPTILKSIYKEPEVEEVKEDNFFVKSLKGTGSSIKGFGLGLFDVGKDTAVGIYHTVTDPIGTGEALYHSVTHPMETYDYIEKAIVDSYERDMINGNAESRSRWITYALGTTATAVVGTKGAGTITKTGAATTKAGAKKAVESAKRLDLNELLPYSSKYQAATVGDVPHGVVNSRKLLENRLLMAEKLTDSGGGLKGPVKGIEEVNPNMIRKVEKDILDQMESVGGHTLERHVGKTNEDLIKRAIQENVEAATSFTDKSTATKAIQENLRKNADDIAKWLNESDTRRKIFDVSHKSPIGKGALEDKKQVIYDLSNSRVVLVRDQTNELGFRILTGFPIVK